MSSSERPWVAVIDDDPSVCRSVTRYIRAQGFAADAYATADEFLERLRTSRPCCIVLDVQLLEGMRSFDLLDRLNAVGARVPIIFMSGLLDLPPVECARYPELRHCLRKPFDAGTLIARVRFVFQGSAGAAR